MQHSMSKKHLHFKGPFSWRHDLGIPCVFEVPEGKTCGIYLWVLRSDIGRFAYYIGETGRSFASRHREHLKEHMAGFYHVLDGGALQEGRKVVIWNGMYGMKSREAIQDLFQKWPTLAPAIEAQTKFIEFFIAPTDFKTPLRREVERALAKHFAESKQNFQDGGVQYRAAKELPPTEVTFSADCEIKHFPASLSLGGDLIDRKMFTTPYETERQGT